ncbi:autotransporter outer membrane beta-barrel domain-containing protein, partial [Escherichia marmotae]|nr:autotransporter outer membrane beta-barrel domain-containing protein [Escherichia marmotae]
MTLRKTQLSIIIGAILFGPASFAESIAVTSVKAENGQSIVMQYDVINSNHNSNAVYANGVNATIDTHGHTIIATGNNASAVHATHGGVINVNDGDVDIHGPDSRAVSASTNGLINVTGARILIDSMNSKGVSASGGDINLKGTTITTKGEYSDGVFSEGEPANSSHINIADSNIQTAGKSSRGIYLANGNMIVSGTEIRTAGDNAGGMEIQNDAVTELDHVSITTSGKERANGLTVGGVLTAQNLSVTAEGSDSFAVAMSEKGYLNVKDSTLVSKQDTALGFTEQDRRYTAVAVLKDSSLHGKVAAIRAVNSAGMTGLLNTTVRSDSGILADIGDNAYMTLDASEHSVLSGITQVATGSVLDFRLSEGSTWESGGNSEVTDLFLDNAKLVISGKDAVRRVGNVITVTGDYQGNNGNIVFNTVLAGDDSATDKLVVRGNTSGKTRVTVNQAGGTGAQTLNGIELIHVDGLSDGEFIQTGRIAAGAYDYMLGRGQGNNSGNWYLTSGKNMTAPELKPETKPETKPEPAPEHYDNDLRPEAGSYTANMAAANTMFMTRLHERLGPVQYTDVMTGETKNTSMWMRHEGGHNRWRDGT